MACLLFSVSSDNGKVIGLIMFSLDGFDGRRAAGSTTVPGTRSGGTPGTPAALQPSVCGPTRQVSAATPL